MSSLSALHSTARWDCMRRMGAEFPFWAVDSPDWRGAGDGGTGQGTMYDCQSCGACCKNHPDNQRQGIPYWVEIKEGDKIMERRDLVRKYVTYDRHKVPHLKIQRDGTCQCLAGSVGGPVKCRIYHQRPSPCRRVQPGDDNCIKARVAHGLEQAKP